MIWIDAAQLAWRNPSYVTRNPVGVTEGARRAYSTAKVMREYRNDLRRRDLFFCRWCGSSSSLHVHHILPISVAPERADDADNLLPLCADCHLHVGHGGNWRDYIENVRDLCRIRSMVVTR